MFELLGLSSWIRNSCEMIGQGTFSFLMVVIP